MRHSIKVGMSFGTTSGIITTLGIMIGLYSVTNQQLPVIGGILTIAVADSLSDALGIHISEESENKHSPKEIWESTFSTFICKFIIASSFIIPVVFLSLKNAVIVSVIWGLLLLLMLSYFITKGGKTVFIKVVSEHIFIAILVIITSYYIGDLISTIFG